LASLEGNYATPYSRILSQRGCGGLPKTLKSSMAVVVLAPTSSENPLEGGMDLDEEVLAQIGVCPSTMRH
jgi:hypothetical protein